MPFVYFLQSGTEHKFKIGRTEGETVENRRRQLATGNPYPLAIYDQIDTEYCKECELYLHHTLRTRNIIGDAREFFAISPNELKSIIVDARSYIAQYAEVAPIVAELQSARSNDVMKSPSNEEISIHRKIVKLREQESAARLRRELLEDRLKVAIGNAAGLDGICTWKTVDSFRFDQGRVREGHPELFQAFLTPSSVRKFHLR